MSASINSISRPLIFSFLPVEKLSITLTYVSEPRHSLTCRYFGIPQKTFYKWKARYNPRDILSLENYSRRPDHFRKPEIPAEIVDMIVQVRKSYPAWSKYKIAVILKRDHKMDISASSVGRILKRKGLISPKASKRRKLASHRKRLRVSRDLIVRNFGDLIQIDTKHLWYSTGEKRYQFVAIDCFGKFKYSKVYKTASSRKAKQFFNEAKGKFPFPIKAVQSDNGSEFQGEFDKLLKELKIPHYFSYPSSPKQNSMVERAIQTDINEFYHQGNLTSDIDEQNRLLRKWEEVYYKIRPHTSLDYLTPEEYYYKHQADKLNVENRVEMKEPQFLPMY